MLAKIFAALGLLICIGLAVHMALPAGQRYRLDAWGRRLLATLRRGWQHAIGWRRRRGMNKAAAEAAEAAIRRARGGNKPDGEWDGNVYRPKRFDSKKRDKRDLH